jgi:hypothetical protein
MTDDLGVKAVEPARHEQTCEQSRCDMPFERSVPTRKNPRSRAAGCVLTYQAAGYALGRVWLPADEASERFSVPCPRRENRRERHEPHVQLAGRFRRPSCER